MEGGGNRGQGGRGGEVVHRERGEEGGGRKCGKPSRLGGGEDDLETLIIPLNDCIH